MANLLTMALVDSIFTLHQRRWSQRRIARELGIDRQTVARYLQQPKPSTAPIGSGPAAEEAKPATAPIGSGTAAEEAKPATAPIGSGTAAEEAKPATAPIGSDQEWSLPTTSTLPVSRPGQASQCEPFREVILAKLELGLSAQRIYQDLVTEHGFAWRYPSVRRFVHNLQSTTPLPFRRLECGPGEEAQVDFGRGAWVVDSQGHRRRPYVFRIVLSHSRKAYSEAVWRQSTDSFLQCLENAWWYFGGVPGRLVLDNLKAAVQQADWYDPDINPKVRAFAQHYGLALWPTRPYVPRHKGKIERGIDYVQENALKGRSFSSLVLQNQFLADWEQNVADTRLHGTTRQQVGKVFAEVERPALGRLPLERFANFQEGRRRVHRDGHVEVDRAFYSVPPEYLGREVWARWDGRLVRILNERLELITSHVQQQPGRFSTKPQHIAGEKISGCEKGAAWLLGRVRLLGPQATGWAEGVIQARGVEGIRVLQGLLSLAKRHPIDQLEQACRIAHSYGSYRLKTVRTLIGRQAPEQATLAFVQEHPLIRSLAEYGQFVHEAFQKEVEG